MNILSTVKRNWFIKLGALVVGLALWAHVKTNQSYDRVIALPLMITEQSGRFVVANEIPDEVAVRIHGTGKDLLFFTGRGRVELSADISTRQVVTLEPQLTDIRGISPSDPVELVSIEEPASVLADLDYLDSRQVEVRGRVDLEIRPGYTVVGPVQIDPAVTHVRGPRRFVREVVSVLTDSVFLSDVYEDVDIDVPCVLPQGVSIQMNPGHVRIRAEVQPLLERRFEDVPVAVRRLPRRTEVRTVPETVTVDVVGGAEVVRALTPGQIHVELDYRKRYELGLDDLPLEARLPENIRLVRMLPQNASLVVRQE